MATGGNFAYHPDSAYQHKPLARVNLAVCIPASNELSLLPVLLSLSACIPVEDTAIFVVINNGETASADVKEVNTSAYQELRQFLADSDYPFSVQVSLYLNLPEKKAGVGLARKLCMDQAVAFVPSDMPLVCLDADCAVATDYLITLSNWFKQNTNRYAASIYFEHQKPANAMLAAGIGKYELHLRYLKHSLKYAGYPWFHHTVGSSMAVRAGAYVKCGGMNTRKAGEDFYFLHKLMPMGFGSVTGTTVFPEARISNRVPFGTGRSLGQYVGGADILTYNPETFFSLKTLFDCIAKCGGWDSEIAKESVNPLVFQYFTDIDIDSAWNNAKENTGSDAMALKRFLSWFSGIRIIRYLNDMRVHYPDIEVLKAADIMASKLNGNKPYKSLTELYRMLDRTELL